MITLFSIGLGVAYVVVTPATFEVQNRLVVREDNPSLEPADRNRLPDREFLATQAEIIRSPLIIRQALDRVPVSVPANYERGDVAFVLESLTVSPVLQTDILKITYRGPDAEQAKAFTTALIEQYRKQVQQGDRTRISDEVEALVRREGELATQLGQLQDEYAKFRRSSPLVGQGREGLILQGQNLDHLSQRWSEARSRRIELEDKVQVFAAATTREDQAGAAPRIVPVAIRAVSETPAAAVSVGRSALGDTAATYVLREASTSVASDLAEVQKELWLAKRNAANLAEAYGPKHPQCRAAQEQVAYWNELLTQRMQAGSAGLLHELSAAKATEGRLQEVVEAERERVKNLDNFLVEETVLTSKIQRTEQALDLVGARLKEHQLTEEQLRRGRSSVGVTLLDGSEVQEQVIWPQPKSLLGLCGLLGLVGGVVVATLRERAGRRRPA